MRLPGFMVQLLDDIKRTPEETRLKLNVPEGLHEDLLKSLLVSPRDESPILPNPPSDHVVMYYHDQLEEYSRLGTESINNREVAYCILAGGTGTRLGEPKALARIPELNMTLLTLKFFQAIGEGPIWVMISPDNRAQIEDHVASLVGIDKRRIHLLEQHQSYRLTPDNRIMFNTDGSPALHTCGHGDIFPVLHRSGRLEDFIASGGKYISIVNVDNVFASLDPAIIGHHITKRSKVTCEVVRRKEKEQGGVLVETAEGLQIIEQFRLNVQNMESYTWLNTNSMIMNVDLEFSRLGRVWHRVMKNIDDKAVVQHERLLQEVTAAYDTTYVGVSRSERFMPIKTQEDLNTVRNIVTTDLT